jgi:Rieske Fe-S protein
MADEVQTPESDEEGARRRQFLYLATMSVGAVGAAAFAWPIIDSMNPASDVLALSSIEVDLGPIQEGQYSSAAAPPTRSRRPARSSRPT